MKLKASEQTKYPGRFKCETEIFDFFLMGEEDIHIDDMARTKRSIEHTGFKSIETVGKMVLFIILRFWRACSAAVLTLFLLYWLYGGVVIFLLFTAAVLGALYHYQDALLYFPEQPETSRVFVQNPSVLGLPYENLYLKSQDGTRINVVFIKQPPLMQACAPTVLFCHGNAGNVGHRLVNAKALHSQLGCNVLLLEYRGYGKSEGSPSEYGKIWENEYVFRKAVNWSLQTVNRVMQCRS